MNRVKFPTASFLCPTKIGRNSIFVVSFLLSGHRTWKENAYSRWQLSLCMHHLREQANNYVWKMILSGFIRNNNRKLTKETLVHNSVAASTENWPLYARGPIGTNCPAQAPATKERWVSNYNWVDLLLRSPFWHKKTSKSEGNGDFM